jgi:multidrug efflux pump subunit AcrA (membrane-fusion protein)
VQASAALRDITPQADPQTRTWRVRATLQNPPAAMALGASVTVVAIVCPARLHPSRLGADPHRRQTGRFCDYPAVAGAAARGGARGYTATSVMIASGLEPGDRVITAGVSTLRSGEPVVAGEVQP